MNDLILYTSRDARSQTMPQAQERNVFDDGALATTACFKGSLADQAQFNRPAIARKYLILPKE